jgi:hypothetical protein
VAAMVARRWQEYGLADIAQTGVDANLFGYNIS